MKIYLIIVIICVTSVVSSQLSENFLNHKNFGLQDCFEEHSIFSCLKKDAFMFMERLVENNDTWHLSDYIVLKKNPSWIDSSDEMSEREDSESLIDQFSRFARSRLVEFKLDPFNEEVGRKKKEKGGMMMFGGMALMAFLAQIVLGKVAFLAGTAIILAKVSLLLSLLSGLKKLVGNGNSSGEHVVLATDHSHGGYSSGGWQRGMEATL